MIGKTMPRRLLVILTLCMVLGCDTEEAQGPLDKTPSKAAASSNNSETHKVTNSPVEKVIEKIDEVKEQAKKVVTDKETRRVVCLAVIYGLKKTGTGMVFKGISGIGTVPLEVSAGLILGGAVIFSGAKLLEDRFEIWGYIKDDPAKEIRFSIPLKNSGQELAELKTIEIQFHKLEFDREEDLPLKIREIEDQYGTVQSSAAAQQYSVPLTQN